MRKVHAWEAADGKTFTSEAECKLHEIGLKLEEAKTGLYTAISTRYTVMASMFNKQDLWRLLATMTNDAEGVHALLGNYIQAKKRLDRAGLKVLEEKVKEEEVAA